MIRTTHVILNTHTPQRLRRTILGVAAQSLRPATVTLSCDSDDPAIAEAARAACAECSLVMTLILRAHTGKSRPAQARNNAVRELLARGVLGDDDAIVFFDGDCVPAHNALERHAIALGKGDVVLGGRYDLSPEQDAAFDEEALWGSLPPILPTEAQIDSVIRRHKRDRRRALLRRLGIEKQHKPKVVGANFAARAGRYLLINGHDETFEGWAQEDDDLGRRVYLSGGSPVVRVRQIIAYHQHHTTRAPRDWKKSTNAHRLTEPCEIRCARGVENPLDQPEQVVIEIQPGCDQPTPSSSISNTRSALGGIVGGEPAAP